MATVTISSRLVLSHDIIPSGPIPTVQDPSGVYPYPSFCATAPRPCLRAEPLVTLENSALRVEVLPAQGGKVFSITLLHDASPPLSILASPPLLRPCRILPRGAFVGGGIELSFPISHTPSLLERVHYETGVAADGRAFVVCGERELRHGMQWSVEWSLAATGPPLLLQRVRFCNPTATPRPWMSWSNAGVPSAPDTTFHYPPGPYLRHGRAMGEVDAVPRTQGDIAEMVGFFWRPPAPAPPLTAFGIHTPSLGAGLFHVSALSGIKLWSDGAGEDERWVAQYQADSRSQLVEMQAGPLHDQSIKAVLPPDGGEHMHCEAWIPCGGKPLTLLEACQLAKEPLRALAAAPPLPLFSWARRDTVARWEALTDAHERGGALPAPPDETSNDWPPSGMEKLGAALAWAAEAATSALDRSRWRFLQGAWLAATCDDGVGGGGGETSSHLCMPAALAALASSEDGRARALLGRLLRRCSKDYEGAAAALCAVEPPPLALHPQVAVERDLALEGAGRARRARGDTAGAVEALAARRKALDALSALEDEALVERRVALLAEEGRHAEARALLLGTRFSLVHQRYVRTQLFRGLCSALGGTGEEETPQSLGEDQLFGWGAYQEHTGE